jgi:hypothetical protein
MRSRVQTRAQLAREENLRGVRDDVRSRISKLQALDKRVNAAMQTADSSSTPYDTTTSTNGTSSPATTVITVMPAPRITSPMGPTTVYTPQTTAPISGAVTGPYGLQGLIRVWKANASVPNDKDRSSGGPFQIGYGVSVPLTGSEVPFTIPNIPLSLNADNYFVVTMSDAAGSPASESMPAQVPVIKQAATAGPAPVPMPTPVLPVGSLSFTNPTAPTTVYAPQTSISISGMFNGGQPGTQVMLRLWKANPGLPNQKDMSSGAEAPVGVPVTLYVSGPSMPFTFQYVPLTLNAPNYFVASIADQYGTEIPVYYPVPLVTQSQMPAPVLAITAPTPGTTVYAPQTTTTVSGTVSGGTPNTQGVVKIWKANPANPAQKDPSAGTVPITQSSPLYLTGGPVSFTIANVPLMPNTTNLLVATLADPSGATDLTTTSIPPVTQSQATQATLSFTNPTAPTTVYNPQTSISISGMFNGGQPGTQVMLRLWKANPALPNQKDMSSGAEAPVGVPIPLYVSGPSMQFSFQNVPLALNAPNYFVASIADQYGTELPVYYPVPLITQSQMPAPVLAITAPTPGTTVYPPQTTTTVSGTVSGGTPNTQGVVKIWKANPANPAQKDPSAGTVPVAQSASLYLTGAPVSFTIANVPLILNTTNLLVATFTDPSGVTDLTTVSIPPIAYSQTPAPVVAITNPISATTVYAPQMATTVSGTVTGGTPGAQSVIKIWKANPANPTQKDPSATGYPLGQSAPLFLTGGPVTFTVQNVVLTANITNLFVASLSDLYGTTDISTTPIPPITQSSTPAPALAITNPVSPMTVYAPQTSATISGTVTGSTPSNQAIVKIWKANPAVPTQKDPTAVSPIAQSAPRPLTGGSVTFSIPNVFLTPGTANLFVATLTDLYATTDLATVSIPSITLSQTGAPAVIISSPASATTVYGPQTMTAISGSVSGGTANTQATVKIWKANPANPTQKDPNTAAFPVAQSAPLYLTGGVVSFSVANVPLTANTVNLFVASLADTTSGVEYGPGPIQVPAITQATSLASIVVTSPSTATTVYAPQNSISISGTATGAPGTQALIRLWKGSSVTPGQKDSQPGTQIGPGMPLTLTGGPVQFTFPTVPLALNTANYFVLTAADAFGTNESPQPTPVPVITHTGGAIAAVVVTNPAAATTITSPQTSTSISGTVQGTYGSQVMVRLWRSSAANPNQKDPASGTEPVQSVSLQMTGAAMPFTFANVNLALDTVNYFLVIAADQAGNETGQPVVPVPPVTQSSLKLKPPVLTKPVGPRRVRRFYADIAGTAAPGSLVEVWRAEGGKKIEAMPPVGARQLKSDEDYFEITVKLEPESENEFLLIAKLGGVDSAPVVVPTLTQYPVRLIRDEDDDDEDEDDTEESS